MNNTMFYFARARMISTGIFFGWLPIESLYVWENRGKLTVYLSCAERVYGSNSRFLCYRRAKRAAWQLLLFLYIFVQRSYICCGITVLYNHYYCYYFYLVVVW